MRFSIPLTALVVGLAVPASAQWPAPVERALSRDYSRCMDSGGAGRGVTPAMQECSGTELDRQDARLNQAYRMTMQRLTRVRQAKLRVDQRAWIGRRDATCQQEADRFRGGTQQPLEYSQCLLRETIARRLWLEKYR